MAALVLARAEDPRPGLVTANGTLSHAEVTKAAAVRAAWLSARRVPGPFHVATLLDNVAEHVLWLQAAALAGAVVVGGNPTHPGDELARDLGHTQCQLLVTSQTFLPLVRGRELGDALGTIGPHNNRVLVVDGDGYEAALAPFASREPHSAAGGDVRPETLGYLLFTSGTSGVPKACRCTQGRLARISVIVAEMFRLGPGDVCYLPMPLFHSNALMAGWGPALAGGATAALPSTGRFSASSFLPDVRRFGATYFNYVGKPLAYVLATPERADDADNPLVRAFGNEGAPADVERFAQRFGCELTDAYGSTEGGAALRRTADTPPGALGRGDDATVVLDPVSGEERPRARFDAHGRLVNPDESIGELVNKAGAAGFEGYWRHEDAERARLRDGWYWTGDLAFRDERGFIYFAGRDDDWLRVDGENFAGAPIEQILQRWPGVMLAAVYAVPDTIVGDQVMAALQLEPGRTFDPAAFAAFLGAQDDLGAKWWPRFVRVAPQLPLTATNKVLKRTLRAEAWRCDDPIWWRRERSAPYQHLSADDAAALDASLRDRAGL